MQVWGVLAREEEPPEGQEAVEWLLLTNVPVESVEAAWGVVTAYQKRWGIEELHKALKTGCRLEGRQHEERGHLENLLALCLLVSVKMLRLRTLSRPVRTNPPTKCWNRPRCKCSRPWRPNSLRACACKGR